MNTPYQWTRVEDSLPYCGKTVIAFGNHGLFTAALNQDHNGKYWIRAPWCTRVPVNETVTHWMDIEPPI